jgi:hypothetical protein
MLQEAWRLGDRCNELLIVDCHQTLQLCKAVSQNLGSHTDQVGAAAEAAAPVLRGQCCLDSCKLCQLSLQQEEQDARAQVSIDSNRHGSCCCWCRNCLKQTFKPCPMLTHC